MCLGGVRVSVHVRVHVRVRVRVGLFGWVFVAVWFLQPVLDGDPHPVIDEVQHLRTLGHRLGGWVGVRGCVVWGWGVLGEVWVRVRPLSIIS